MSSAHRLCSQRAHIPIQTGRVVRLWRCSWYNGHGAQHQQVLLLTKAENTKLASWCICMTKQPQTNPLQAPQP
eukprot:scaffold13542_cov20-Tisochrysis_lutea.AAC.1